MKEKKLFIFLIFLFINIIPLFALTHEELAKKILINNPSLIKYKNDISISNLDLKDAKAKKQPTIDFLITSTYMSNPPVGKIVVNPDDYLSGESGTSGTLTPLSAIGLDGPLTVYKGMENTQYNFKIVLTQPLYTWNKINKSIEIYESLYTLKNKQANIKYKQLINELEIRESTLYFIKEMKENLLLQIQISNKLLDIINQSFKNDFVLEIDLLEAKIKAKEIDLAIAELEKQEKTQLTKIRELVNDTIIKSDDIEYIFDEKRLEEINNEKSEQLIKLATAASNDNIQLLSILKNIKEKELSIAKNDIYWKPDFALQVEASYSGPRFPLIERGYYTQNQAGINVTLAIKSTIWDGGIKLNEIKREKLNNENINQDILISKNQITQTIMENLAIIEYIDQKIEYQEQNSLIIENKIKNLNLEITQGYGNKTDILYKEIEYLNSELQIINQKLERSISYFTILYLIN